MSIEMLTELLNTEMIKGLDKLDTYIKSIGDLPRPEDIRECGDLRGIVNQMDG